METKNNILLQDIQQVVRSVDLSELKNSSIFVTGATGLLGSFIIRVLLYLNKTENYNVQIFALIRNKEKAEKVFGEHSHNDNINWIIGDIRNFNLEGNVDYIIHGASVTSSQDFLYKPVETITTALYGTEKILETAKELKVKSLVYLSSMEVFGITDTRLDEVRESDYGYIDILNPRSSYSEGKRLCECLCASYASEYGVPVKIARLTQTLGSGIDYNDSRVAAQFMRAVIENKAGRITKKEIMNLCPDISRVTVERTLTDLVKSGCIQKVGAGPSTGYVFSGRDNASSCPENH